MINKEQLVLVLENKNQRETAQYFGVNLMTIKRAIKRFGIKYTKKSGGHYLYRNNPLDLNLTLTEEQEDIIIGSLLGDGFC